MPEFPEHRDCLGLSEAVRAHPAFQEIGREIRYRKGAYIWRPEDAADRLHVLQQGQVVELRGPSASNRIITRVVTPGEPFGYLCASARRKAAFEVQAPGPLRTSLSWK